MATVVPKGTVRGAAFRMLGAARADPLAALPVEAFNDALIAAGDARGAGRAVARAWARMNPSVARDLAGDPAGLLGVLAREFWPFLLDDPSAGRVESAEADRAVLVLGGGLLDPFKAGLAEGFASLAGVAARAECDSEDRVVVRWSREAAPRSSAFARLVATARAPFLAATLVPFLVGTAVAFSHGAFDPLWFALALAGALLVHVGTNAANDYFDHLSGADRADPEPFTGGTRPILRGVATASYVARVAVVSFALAAALGLLLAWARGPGVLWLGLAGAAIGLFYTMPPVALAARGLGTLAAAVGFGPVMVLGAYYVQTGAFALEPVVASLPIAALVAALLHLNEFPGRLADAAAGKRTVVVRFGPAGARWAYHALVVGAFASLAAGVAAGIMPRAALLSLLAAPAAVFALSSFAANWREPRLLSSANAWTVALHLGAGALLAVGYLVAGWSA